MPEIRFLAGMIVRNEADRYLRQVLERLSQVVDKIVIVDDASTDSTPDICRSFPKVHLKKLNKPLFRKNEALLRTKLWNEIRKFKPKWVLIIDADEIIDLSVKDAVDDMERNDYHWAAIRICDMWTDKHYRIDGNWSPVAVRLFKFEDKPFGAKRKIHCANIPSYLAETNNGTCYSNVRIKHMAWSKQEDRERKYREYSRYTKEELGEINYEHLQSVLSKDVTLKTFHDEIILPRILIASLIRNREWCLNEFLDGIYSQDYPKDKLSVLFVANNCTDNTIPMLKEWADKHRDEYNSIRIVEKNYPITEQEGEHVWSAKKIDQMIEMRNYCLNSIDGNDYLFFIDSDIVLQHPRTLKHLSLLDKDVIAEVFWAKWGKLANPPLANVWARGFYEYSWDFFALLRRRGIYGVGGCGACELISRRVIKAGVNFDHVFNLPSNMIGEDRNFCTRCAVAGFRLWASSFFTPLHLERETYELRKKYEEWKKKHQKVKLSLAMICKDEESFMPMFFTEYAWLFDEIVVVDTGSTDHSKQIAKKFGAKVYDYEGQWEGNENLGAARNQALAKCTGDWICQLDFDEALPEPLVIREIIEDTPMDCFLFDVANIQEDQKYTLSDSIRLFRNNLGLYYTGICHETIEDSIKEKGNLKIGRFPKPLIHHGYLKGKHFVQKKLDLYFRMNQRQLEKNRKDPRPWFNLALHYINDGDEETGIRYLEKAAKLKPDFMLPRKELGLIYLRKARDWLMQAASIASPNSPYGKSVRNILKGISPFVSEGVKVGLAGRNQKDMEKKMKELARRNKLKEPGFYK
ncbi:glycosyltransferase family 2 protein [Candidatus Aerophobetes bacterium]|nr:glycosyltransferase family 2 protein [Candidatus Aerophobetes bacterium]